MHSYDDCSNNHKHQSLLREFLSCKSTCVWHCKLNIYEDFFQNNLIKMCNKQCVSHDYLYLQFQQKVFLQCTGAYFVCICCHKFQLNK